MQNLCNLRCPASKIGSRTRIASSCNFPYLKKSWKWWKVLIFYFQSYSKCLINELLPFGKIIIPSLLTCGQLRHSLQNEKFQNSLKSALLGRDYCTYICSASWKKLGSNDFTYVYLLTFSLQKELFFVLKKSLEKDLNYFWILKCVWVFQDHSFQICFCTIQI